MASRSVNKVILLGRLGKDAETKFTAQGTPRTTFTMATSRRWKDQQTGDWREETDWHNISLWRGENVAPYLTKGKQVYVEGRISNRQYEDKDGQKRTFTEVVADDVILVGGGRDEAGGGGGGEMGDYGGGGPVSMPRSARPAASRPPQGGGGGGGSHDFDPGISDDDVPF
jgi:single-strand DNA-binding protein